MQKILIHDATIINQGREYTGHVIINGDRIIEVIEGKLPKSLNESTEYKRIDAKGKLLMPGVIDDQVHFREPGLTHKANIETESLAAAYGGTTTFMEMPNTKPSTTTMEALYDKLDRANGRSTANYSFFFGASNDNLDIVKALDPTLVPGVKVFMGSSTGNMLVDDEDVLRGIFKHSPTLVATHCEDEATIKKNMFDYVATYGDGLHAMHHPMIRNADACYLSSSKAIELANAYDARLHILHISTAREIALFAKGDLADKNITAEACVHHLWFTEDEYPTLGNKIKCNPAIKSKSDRAAIRAALLDGRIDVMATDHAPHTVEEKSKPYVEAPSGLPLVQHSLQMALALVEQGVMSRARMVELMCHNPARLFAVHQRGYIKAGYFADLVLVDPKKPYTINQENILHKCAWSPLEGHTFSSSIEKTFINGICIQDEPNARPGVAAQFQIK